MSSAAVLSGAPLLYSRTAWTQSFSPIPRTVVNVMLIGGADFRYVLAPAPDFDPTYLNEYWSARRGLYVQGYPDYAAMYAAEYRPVMDPLSGSTFGIHRTCGWLAERFAAGDVAVVSNVLGSANRRHDHSQLIVDAGDPTAHQAQTLRDGWGGRLVEAIGGDSKVAVVSEGVSIFAMGRNPDHRLARVVHARNSRDMALPTHDAALSSTHPRNNLTRALRAYYAARGAEVAASKPANWPYLRFFQQYRSIDAFGAAITQRLATQPLPAALANLSLHRDEFAQQCRNAYDCAVASDILGCRVVSMSYDGWDSHGGQQSKINAFLPDVFGSNGGLATLSAHLNAASPGAADNLVFVFNSDFGRQLAANGGRGTDHGRATSSLLIGGPVRGGVYGEMFPAREARPDPDDSLGRSPFRIPGTDIKGLTSFERVLAKVCDWAAPSAGAVAFPGAASSALEAGVDLSSLLSA